MVDEPKTCWLGKTEAARNAIYVLSIALGLFSAFVVGFYSFDITEIVSFIPVFGVMMIVFVGVFQVLYLIIKRFAPDNSQFYNTFEWMFSLAGLFGMCYCLFIMFIVLISVLFY